MPAALFVSVFSGALERGGIASAPPLIRAFWKAHVFSISILALFIVVMSVLAVFLLDMPSYLPIAAAPLAYISYRVMRHKYSVIEVNLCAAVMVALVCFVLAVAGGSLFGGRIDEIRASGDMVSRLSAGYDKLYLFVNDTRAAWAVRRTAYEVEPVGIRIEKFPALILVEENSMHHLIPWAKERGISHKEIYNFLYDPPRREGASFKAYERIRVWFVFNSELFAHRGQEIFVRRGVIHLIQQEFHALHRVKRLQDLPQYPDAVQVFLGDEEFFFSRA